MKNKVNYFIPKEDILSLLKEAEIENVEYIIPLKIASFHYVYKIRNKKGTYILKVQKNNHIILHFEKNYLLNEYNVIKLLLKNSDLAVSPLLYTNANWKEQKKEEPTYIFSLYNYIIGNPINTLKPSKDEKNMLDFSYGEIIGTLSSYKARKFGYLTGEQYLNYFEFFKVQVKRIMQDELNILNKVTPATNFLNNILERVAPILITVKPQLANLDFNTSNLFYLNKNEKIVLTNLGNVCYGDYIGNFVGFNMLERLDKKDFIIQGFNSTYKDVLNVDDVNLQIRYYLLVLLKSIILNLHRVTRYKPWSIKGIKLKTLYKTSSILAKVELSHLLNISEKEAKNLEETEVKEIETIAEEDNEIIEDEKEK